MGERIYVAASYEQIDEVGALHSELESLGHTITADWTTHKEIDSIESAEEREVLKRQYAIEDALGVATASVFVLLLTNRKSTGAHIELGIAIGAQVAHICLVGEANKSQLFYDHPSVTKLPDKNAFLEMLACLSN